MKVSDEATELQVTACRIADAWVQYPRSWDLNLPIGRFTKEFREALDRIESLTQDNPLRTRRKGGGTAG